MKLPIIFEAKQLGLYKEIKTSLIELINSNYNGHYTRKNDHQYIKLSYMIGKPIVYDIKIDDDRILCHSMLWHGDVDYVGNYNKTFYELHNDDLLNVYKTLHDITFPKV
jgi:hypothetical protein